MIRWLFEKLVKIEAFNMLCLARYVKPDPPKRIIQCQWKECFENEDGYCILDNIIVEKRISTNPEDKTIMWCSEFGAEIKEELPPLLPSCKPQKSMIKELLMSTKGI